MDTVDGMRAFVAVAGQQSFTAGAKQLGINTNVASKYVKQLESKLGAQLFHRTTRSVTLTETGRAYFERCVPLLDQLDELEGLVQERQTELSGVIRVTAPTGFGAGKLIEALLPFQEKHPKVTIDLHLSDQLVAIVEEGFDLAIRIGQLKDSTLIARNLMKMPLVVVASPDYLARCGEPLEPSDLQMHNCLLQMASADPEHWAFCIDGETQVFRVSGSFHANSPLAIAQMTVGGLGISRCPLYTAEPFLERGELQLLFEQQQATNLRVHAVYPSNRHLTARIRALIDHLVDVFA